MDRFASPPAVSRRSAVSAVPEAPRRRYTEIELVFKQISMGNQDETGHAALLALLQRDAGAAFFPGYEGQPPIHFALQCRCPPAVLALLLQHGASVDELDIRGRSLLCRVLLMRNFPQSELRSTKRAVDLCILLLNHGATPPAAGAAVAEGNEACLRCLRQHGDCVRASVLRRADFNTSIGICASTVAGFLDCEQ